MSLFSGCFVLNFACKVHPIRNTRKISIGLHEQNRFVRVGYPSGWLSLGQGMTREREEKRKLQPHKNDYGDFQHFLTLFIDLHSLLYFRVIPEKKQSLDQ